MCYNIIVVKTGYVPAFVSEKVIAMHKKYYISKNLANVDTAVPEMDRFARIEKLNAMLKVGWVIKGVQNDEEGTYFLLEKNI